MNKNTCDNSSGGVIIFVAASRAYPHGCLYRHPSYYTYDERDDISWFGRNENNRNIAAADSFADYRKLPPRNHPLRKSYQQYKLIRRLGAGKFSNVFEALDVALADANAAADNAAVSTGDDGTSGISNNEDDDVIKKSRRKKIHSLATVVGDEDGTVESTATDASSSSDIEDPSSLPKSSSSTTAAAAKYLDPNTLVVLKCLKPISERKIRRELLVLMHCRNLPNLARLIGIVVPASIDDDNDNERGENGEMESDNRLNGGKVRRHPLNQNQKKRRRRCNNHRITRQLQRKQQQQPQDIGSLTTDTTCPAVDVASQRSGISYQSHPLKSNNDDDLKDENHSNNNNNSNTNQYTHHDGEQAPALVLEHAGKSAQWFCHGPRPSSLPQPSITTATATATTSNADGANDNSYPTNRKSNHPYHYRHSYQNHLTEYEIKYYLCHLLIALDGLHAAGIMHRDVKPRNILINLNSEPVTSSAASSSRSFTAQTTASRSKSPMPPPPPPPLMLVDLGLADFYLPGKEFNVRVASRHYKSPELLIGYEYYDYAIDMWSVGCILAGLLFRIDPFFRGVDNEDQLGQIVNCLGTRDFLPYCRKCNVRLSSKARAAIGKYCSESSSSSSQSEDKLPISLTNSDIGRRKPWLSFLTPDCPIPSPEATDLLDKLLVYDHEQRWTAREALAHSFFDEVRDKVWSEVEERIRCESSQRQSTSSV